LGAVRRLTDEETDTSRYPRVAILDRLAETIDPGRATDLLPFALDYDDAVGAAARRAYKAVASISPLVSGLRRRYPYQPAQAELADLPAAATMRLEEGSVVLRLLVDVAPVTIARFAALANAGFYNNRIFHRVVPNFIVQGGSPGANEFMGAPRFMRDELSLRAPHVRGAVGISTRGEDTGDGQIFIDLVDVPRLDRDYTVFAYVTKGMDLVDNLLEGAKLLSITVK
jgi:cyclophilin family peptidyl-prolyl cis-trans isomerase